jgi:hypothetical protein
VEIAMEHESSRSGLDPQPRTSQLADDVLDELMPGDLDWRHLVRSYPFPMALLALLAGFVLGRHRGHLLLAALSGFAVHQATENITSALERAGITVPADEPGSRSPQRDA